MLILAIDSTAVTASVCLAEDEKPLARYTLTHGNTHSETLLPMIKSCLDQFGYTPEDIDLFALSAGPGSFTGVRIGAATVKGLAFGTGKPCAQVSTLEALAYNLIGQNGILCPVMNARRGQVYNALFRSENGHMTRLCADRALSIEELEQELLTYREPVYLSGDGYDITRENLRELQPMWTPPALREENAYSVSQIAREMFLRGETVTDRELKPVYLRLSQAERERLARENPGGVKL